jgi:uncharacterized repeat protein (TIGR01451 family)
MMRISKSVLCRVAQLVLLLVAGIGYAESVPPYSDPCTPALPLGSATGCGALITVTLVDGNGNAVAFTVTIPSGGGGGVGNGNPYDGTEDTLVGIVNSSGAPLTSITLSAADTSFGGIFNFDHDGPCGYRGFTQDCFNDAKPLVDPGDYQGPNNTFTVGAGTPCGKSATCYTSGTVNFMSSIPIGGSTWFALEGLPQSVTEVTQTGQPINPGSAANLIQSYVFNNTPDQHVEIDFKYDTAYTNGDLAVVANTIPTVSNQGITHAMYEAMVEGTSLAMTDCFTAPGEGTDANGNSLCAQLTLTCTNADSNIPAGDNCPYSDDKKRNLYWGQQLDSPGMGINIPSGSAPSLPMGSDTWSPGNCTLTGLATGLLCPQSTLTQFALTSADNGLHGGGNGTLTNSSFLFVCCQIEHNTAATVPVWLNSTTVPVSFTTSPPTPLNPTNNWVAAPNQSITFGVESLGATPDTTFPVAGDQTFTNPVDCPSAWPTPGSAPPPSFTAGGNVTVSGEGYYEVHYFSTACDNQEELKFPASISAASPNNVATFKTAPFSVDLTLPNPPSITLSPPGGYIAQFASLNATVACFDPSSSAVQGLFSGIAYCGSQLTPQAFSGNQQSQTTTQIPLSTGTLGTNTFTAIAKDAAGNSSTSSVSYQVVGPDNVGIAMLSKFLVETGTNLTYYIFVVNGGPNAAAVTSITDTLPVGTQFVSSGYAIDSCSFPKGQPPSCSILPPTASCGNGAPGTCSIGTLPVWTSRNPIGALVQITVNVTASPKTTLTNKAVVSGANTNTDVKFTTAAWITAVTK